MSAKSDWYAHLYGMRLSWWRLWRAAAWGWLTGRSVFGVAFRWRGVVHAVRIWPEDVLMVLTAVSTLVLFGCLVAGLFWWS